ncbi:MAG TPA: N-acetyltransferase [Rhizobiales bacterium]|nr:N-acetyltransferase [Hyphomicrobiales bacterium]
MTDPEFALRPERAEDIRPLRKLAEETFGPGRFVRTAHRVREGAPVAADLSLTAWREDKLAGSIRFSAIRVGARSGALLLGPLMVAPRWAGKGCGRALIAEGLELARARGYVLVLLVGDLPYYERFGFVRVPPGQITLPGPVDPARVLAAELAPGALRDYEGPVTGGVA